MTRLSITDRLGGADDKTLKAFESSFKYPLGDKSFVIQHGSQERGYVKFFDSLGARKTFGVSNGDKLVGTGCAVLRCVRHQHTQSFWYLCDFKLDPTIQGKRVLLAIVLKYVLSYYRKSKNMLAINMSPAKDNGLIKKLKKYFFFLKLNVTPLFFYEWSVGDYQEMMLTSPKILSDYVLLTNEFNKDIIIDGLRQPIYHLVDRLHTRINLLNHKEVCLSEIGCGEGELPPMIMLATVLNSLTDELQERNSPPSYEGTVIHSEKLNIHDLMISSLEV
jgi:hypothetical protein